MTRAYLLLLALVVIWGSHWVVVKVGLETIPPFTYGVLRLLGGIVVLAALMGLTGRLKRPERMDWPIIVSYGLLAVALGIAMMNLALPHIPAGRSSILAYTIPLWVVPVMFVVAPATTVLPAVRKRFDPLTTVTNALVRYMPTCARASTDPFATPVMSTVLLSSSTPNCSASGVSVKIVELALESTTSSTACASPAGLLNWIVWVSLTWTRMAGGVNESVGF